MVLSHMFQTQIISASQAPPAEGSKFGMFIRERNNARIRDGRNSSLTSAFYRLTQAQVRHHPNRCPLRHWRASR